jgi:hypothetical protein
MFFSVFFIADLAGAKQKYWRLIHKLRSLGFIPVFREHNPVWVLKFMYDGKTE